MANSNTAHSRRLRAETAEQRAQTIIDAGGWRLRILLQPEPAAALRAEMMRTNESATAIISRLLLQKKQDSC